MTPVVIDASAGVEILANTAHGRRLARLLPTDAVGWVPEHFYVEVAGVVRHQTVVTRTLTEEAAEMVLGRLDRWHLRRAQPGPDCGAVASVATGILRGEMWRLRVLNVPSECPDRRLCCPAQLFAAPDSPDMDPGRDSGR